MTPRPLLNPSNYFFSSPYSVCLRQALYLYAMSATNDYVSWGTPVNFLFRSDYLSFLACIGASPNVPKGTKVVLSVTQGKDFSIAKEKEWDVRLHQLEGSIITLQVTLLILEHFVMFLKTAHHADSWASNMLDYQRLGHLCAKKKSHVGANFRCGTSGRVEVQHWDGHRRRIDCHLQGVQSWGGYLRALQSLEPRSVPSKHLTLHLM